MKQLIDQEAAVIDVGSNSVRLVIYRMEGRSLWTIYNEKVLAGLGVTLTQSGQLSPKGREAALTALRRFRMLTQKIPRARVFAMATAAVREASDGPEFVQLVKKQTGLDLRVLSGPEEATYSALGVLAGDPGACGVVGDLGGASLELTHVADGSVGTGVTLSLGPFSVRNPEGKVYAPDDLRSVVGGILAPHSSRFKSEQFHAVGGAWRNLALLHMRMNDYPLQVTHQYQISAEDAVQSCRIIAQQSRGSLERIEGISKRRLETLPHAAVVLEQLILCLGISQVRFSAYGLREGILLESLPERVRRQDPLLAGAVALGVRRPEAGRLGAALEHWLGPLMSSLSPVFGDRDSLLLSAACRLADLGSHLHPDHRADLVFEQVLRAPISGQTHSERAFLAQTVFSRHSSNGTPPQADIISRLLSDDAVKRARILGAAIRLGCDLSGRNADLLALSQLRLESEGLCLSVSPTAADLLLSETSSKRGATLAARLGVPFRMT
jgi:exopolyphosphatase/guanosine-5'-triphosphate,3'-diphosphate pyrophosphatase